MSRRRVAVVAVIALLIGLLAGVYLYPAVVKNIGSEAYNPPGGGSTTQSGSSYTYYTGIGIMDLLLEQGKAPSQIAKSFIGLNNYMAKLSVDSTKASQLKSLKTNLERMYADPTFQAAATARDATKMLEIGKTYISSNMTFIRARNNEMKAILRSNNLIASTNLNLSGSLVSKAVANEIQYRMACLAQAIDDDINGTTTPWDPAHPDRRPLGCLGDDWWESDLPVLAPPFSGGGSFGWDDKFGGGWGELPFPDGDGNGGVIGPVGGGWGIGIGAGPDNKPFPIICVGKPNGGGMIGIMPGGGLYIGGGCKF